jgi:ribonuclease P protein subunit RPR2
MTRYNSKNKKLVKQIASVRMNYLFRRAEDIFIQDKMLANRYVGLARKYAQRAKIKIPVKWKRRICHNCKKFLYPGVNCRYRLHSRNKYSHVSMTCLECNKTTRYIIKKTKD